LDVNLTTRPVDSSSGKFVDPVMPMLEMPFAKGLSNYTQPARTWSLRLLLDQVGHQECRITM
jgi:hypothetical protein